MLKWVVLCRGSAGTVATRAKRRAGHVLMALALSIAPVAGAGAQTRVDSRSLGCKDLQARVRQAGSLIIASGANVFDRYVYDGQFCSVTQIATPSFVPTRDAASCLVYLCRDRTSGSSR